MSASERSAWSGRGDACRLRFSRGRAVRLEFLDGEGGRVVASVPFRDGRGAPRVTVPVSARSCRPGSDSDELGRWA